MQAYIYCADIYCEDCGDAIRYDLEGCGDTPEDSEDETSYDSDEYPKGPYPDGGGKADCPQHCGSGADCVNAIELSDGQKIGAWLENPLTAEGVEYVRESIIDVVSGFGSKEVVDLWADWYQDDLDA